MDEFLKAWAEFQQNISAPVEIEYRVYYDPTSGKVLQYTTEKIEGEYILVDKNTFAQNRFDYKVSEGKLIPPVGNIGKLRPDTKGTACHPADITIIVADSDAQYWNNHTYDN